MSNAGGQITRAFMMGGKPPEAVWDNPEVLSPSIRGWMGREQKQLLRSGIQPVPMQIRQPQIANWQAWQQDLMLYGDFLLQINAPQTALIGQSAGATALLWLMQEFSGFGVEKLVMVDPWKPGVGGKHKNFNRAEADPIRDLDVFRRIGEVIIVLSGDDDSDQPEVATYCAELIAQIRKAQELATCETTERGLGVEPIHSAELTVIDMPGRGHFVGLNELPEMLDIVTAERGGAGKAMVLNHRAVRLGDDMYQLPPLAA